MKPHEETWYYDELNGTVNDSLGTPLDFFSTGPGKLAAAAPEMARALLALLAEKQGVLMTRAEADLFTAAQMALTKAGVLP